MSGRNFPSFLDAYYEYAVDGFAPDRFHRWVGLSILAAAVERKVSLKQGRIHHIPNIYTMLVSHPAVGKTTAMDAGVDLLEKVKADHNYNFRIIPNQTNEPAFIDMMKIIDRIPLPNNPNIMLPQSAGFFYASEASASALQNTCGDFVATLTAFYDCPRWFRKKLKSEQNQVEIENGCMNLLAGSTFNYLKTLVNEQSVLGGFASRLIYIVHEERHVREAKWGSSMDLDSSMAQKLVEDLAHINKLIGPMKPTADFIARWEKWQPEFDQALIDLNSERLEAITSRKGTNLIKIAMLLSISEGDSLVVTGDHFDRALELIEDAYKDNPKIIAFAAMADMESQKGLTQFIMRFMEKNGGTLPKSAIMSAVMSNGNDTTYMDGVLQNMILSGWIHYTADNHFKIGTNPDDHL
jgi:hypothetical protein